MNVQQIFIQGTRTEFKNFFGISFTADFRIKQRLFILFIYFAAENLIFEIGIGKKQSFLLNSFLQLQLLMARLEFLYLPDRCGLLIKLPSFLYISFYRCTSFSPSVKRLTYIFVAQNANIWKEEKKKLIMKSTSICVMGTLFILSSRSFFLFLFFHS